MQWTLSDRYTNCSLYYAEYFSLYSDYFLKNKNFSYPYFSFCWLFNYLVFEKHNQTIKIGQRRGDAPVLSPLSKSSFPFEAHVRFQLLYEAFLFAQNLLWKLFWCLCYRCHCWALNSWFSVCCLYNNYIFMLIIRMGKAAVLMNNLVHHFLSTLHAENGLTVAPSLVIFHSGTAGEAALPVMLSVSR